MTLLPINQAQLKLARARPALDLPVDILSIATANPTGAGCARRQPTIQSGAFVDIDSTLAGPLRSCAGNARR